jgi:hypothetical protein
MSDVAGVRQEIEGLVRTANVEGVQEIAVPVATLEAWVPRLRREPPVHRPRPGSQRMSHELARKIRNLDREGLNHQQISARLNINSGRVSEVLTGARWDE